MKRKLEDYLEKTDGTKDLQFLRNQMKSYVECASAPVGSVMVSKLSDLLCDSLIFKINSLRSHHKDLAPLLSDLMHLGKPLPATAINHLISSASLSPSQRQAVVNADTLCKHKHAPTPESEALLISGPIRTMLNGFALGDEDPLGSNALTRALFYASILETLSTIEASLPGDYKMIRTLATKPALQHLSNLIAKQNIPEAERHEFYRFLYWHCLVYTLKDYLSAKNDPFLEQYGTFLVRAHDFLHRGQKWAFVDCTKLATTAYNPEEKEPLERLQVRFWDSQILKIISECAPLSISGSSKP